MYIHMLIHMKWKDENYQCDDGHALITDNNWVLLCPPNDEIVSLSPMVLNEIPSLSPSIAIGEYHIGYVGCYYNKQ